MDDIQELTSVQSWSHVSTDCNPADILSRGVSPAVLENADLWWGPAWLRNDESSWSKVARPSVNVEELLEQQKAIVAVSASQQEFDIGCVRK